MTGKNKNPACGAHVPPCVLRELADAVVITDRDGRIEYVNPAFEQITGYCADEVLGRAPNILSSGRQGVDFYERMWAAILAGRPFRDVFVNRRKDGNIYYEEKTITPLRDAHGVIARFIAIGKDITARIHHDERLIRLAYYDSLTGLANRVLYRDRLVRAMRRAHRNEELIAVVFLDLDAFKPINDSFGHQTGDQLLISVAERLKSCIRTTDTLARIAGDEFLFLLEGLRKVDDAVAVLEQINGSFGDLFQIESRQLAVRASMGVAFYPFGNCTSETLVGMADRAMYRAKKARQGGYCFYDAELDDGAQLFANLAESALSIDRRARRRTPD